MSASSDELPFAVASRPLAFGDEMEAVVADLAADADIDAEQALQHAAAVHAEWVATLASQAPPPEESARAASPADTAASARPPAVIAVGGRQMSLESGKELIVGRRGEAVVDHPLVSRRHVELEATSDGLIARDLGSANGTWLVRDGVRTVVDGAGCALSSADRLVTVNDRELLSVIEVGS